MYVWSVPRYRPKYQIHDYDTLTSSAQDDRKAAGLSTCSRTSIEHTTSNRFDSLRIASADVWRYVSEPLDVIWLEANESRSERRGSAEACSEAMAIFDSDASIPTVRAPSRARLYMAQIQVYATLVSGIIYLR